MLKLFLRWLRNPSLQFIVAFLVAPMFSLVGKAMGGVATFIGLLIACLLISITAARSYRHERKQLPPGRLLRKGNYPMANYLVGVAMIWVFATAGILFSLAMLIVDCWLVFLR